MRVKLAFIFGFLFSIVNVFAQNTKSVQNQFKFKYLTIDQGLSNNNIRSICEDSYGMLWFATQNGLNKFDGQTVVNYWNDTYDTNSISSNQINCLLLDSKNNLWIGSAGGLDMYNAELDNFIHIHHYDQISDLNIEQIFAIAEDKNQVLWFGGVSGLYSYDLNTEEIKFFNIQPGNIHGIPPNAIFKLLVDNDNKVWISVLNEGLYVMDQKNSTYTIYKHDENDTTTISGNRIEKIYQDKNGVIWAGTLNNGLNRFVPESNSFVRIIPDPDKDYANRVRAMFEDLEGDFYIGTRLGLYRLDKQQNQFIHYAHEGHSFTKLSQNSILDCLVDKNGKLWIGTFAGGVNYSNLNRKKFTHFYAGVNNKYFLSSANVYALTEDKKGNIWIGGDNGLNYLDKNDYTFTYYQNDPENPNSLSYNDVKALAWDENENLWIGTNRGGLNYYNTKTGKFTVYRHDPEDPNSISADKIYGLLSDSEGNLWIILNRTKEFIYLNIDILPAGQDKFIHLNEKCYFGFDQNKSGEIFIGGKGGFWNFNRNDSIFNFIANEQYIGNVNTVKQDSKGVIWVGSPKGLVRYDNKDKSFRLYSIANNYPIDEVFGILEDESANLWVSTNSGLVKILNIVNDTTNVQTRVYDQYDGIQSKQFNYNAYYKSSSGKMIFGGINGFNTFFPEQIKDDTNRVNVVLTNLKLFNNTVPIGKKVDGKIILKKSISSIEELTFGPDQNIFTIEFVSPQNSNAGKITYKTKLVGLDEEWQYRKANNNQVTYTNLAPGKYTFLVSAANSDGYWNENYVSLDIIITPPLWKNWWFILLASVLFLVLIGGVYYYRMRSMQEQNFILEKAVNNRTQEITEKNEMLHQANSLLHEKQNEIINKNNELELHRNNLEAIVHQRTNELEKALERAKESDALKSTFLANMSHEIRTPMNAIMGFANILNDEDYTREERAEFNEIINANLNSLLKIIDEILDLSLIESNQLQIVKEVFDLNVLIDQIYSYYSILNKESQIDIRKNNSFEDKNLKLNSDALKVKQVLTCLMDNACKFTNNGYVEIGVIKDKTNVGIYVKDTGKGIPKNKIDQIFKQFIKIEDENSDLVGGLGLGLTISQKTAEALGGKIFVESLEGEGSTFTLNLPVTELSTDETHDVQPIISRVSSDWTDKTILIAEDVEANYMYLKSVLKNSGAHILWAKDGAEALKMVTENQKIDIVLMDIKMPVMNGYDAAKKIKEIYPNQIIIAQTAYARPQEKYRFYDDNFDEYLSKPIKKSDAVKVLEKFLG